MNMRVSRFVALVVVLALLASVPLVGCQKKPAQPYKIGMVVALTGAGSVYGTEERETAELAVKWINEKGGGIKGHPLELVIEDSKTDPATALTKFKKLDLEAKVSAIMVATSSAEAIGLSDEANQARVPSTYQVGTLELLPRLEAEGSYSFRAWYTVKNQTDTVFAALVGRGAKKIAFMYEDTAGGQSGLNEIHELVKTNPSVQIVTEIKYSSTGLDMTAEAIKVKGINPDAVQISSGGVPSGAVVAKNLREVGYTGLIGISNGIYSKVPGVGSIVNGVLTDLIGPAPGEAAKDIPNQTPELAKLLDWGQQNNRTTGISYPSMFGWDYVFMLADALRQAGPDRQKIRDFLENYEYVGTVGTYKFSPRQHEGLKLLGTFRVMEARDGQWVVVK